MKKTLWLSCLLFALSLSAFAKPLATEDFSSLPDVSSLSLSGSGEKIASVIRLDVENQKGSAVQVANIKTGEKKMVLFTDNSKYIINWVRWKDERTLLVGTVYPSQRDTWTGMGQARFKTRESRLLIVDTEAEGVVRSPFKNTFLKKYKILPSGLDQVVDALPNDPQHILMALPALENSWSGFTAVFKVNIIDQKIETVQTPVDNVWSWMADQQHRIRIGSFQKDEIVKTLVRDIDSEKWWELWPYKIFSEEQVSPISFGADPDQLYIRAYHQNRLAIFKVNLKDPKLTKTLVFADPERDIEGSLIYSPVTKDVIGVSGSGDGGSTFFDPGMQKLQLQIDSVLPKTKNYISSLSYDLQKYIVYSTSDIDSGTYYLGQRNPAKLDAIAYRYKKLTPELMAAKKSITYKARDGLEIRAYLTLPKDGTQKNLPTIMLPHGGPISNNDDSFDYWVQYLANKGYAVLQMNFRGSSGQGLEFRNAGLKNWGMAMQDDIEDGAKKLIAEGIADANAIGIMGASYGGYAALMGAVKTPDFYKFAVSVAGVSNVYDLVKDNRAFWRGYNVVDAQIGNDNSHLREISPVNYAKKIKVPILLIHGDSDRQVDKKHSEQMHAALQKEGKNVTYLSLPDEDHFLTNEESRRATFRAMDEFLDKYFPVKK
ncbi:MAG: S9 family peptidase [Pseudomonadota bacterium]